MSMSAATEQIMFDEMMRVRKHGKYSPHESNYTRLFGTPERAARTIATMMDKCSDRPHGCDGCLLFDVCDDEINALEWLRGDAE